MWMEMHPSWSFARRVYISAKSPGDGAEDGVSFVLVASRAKNSSLFMSTPSLKVSSPKRPLSGPPSMSQRCRHAPGTAHVQTVTPAHEHSTFRLIDGIVA